MSITRQTARLLAALHCCVIAALIPCAPAIRTVFKAAGASYPAASKILLFSAPALAFAGLAWYYVSLSRRLSKLLLLGHALLLVLLLLLSRWLIAEVTIAYTHIVSYALLAVWMRLALPSARRPILVLEAAALAACVGLIDELVQGLHPARVCDPIDMLLNFFSALLGLLIYEPFAAPAPPEHIPPAVPEEDGAAELLP